MKDLIVDRAYLHLLERRFQIALETDKFHQRAIFEKENRRYKNAKDWREEAHKNEILLKSTFPLEKDYLKFRKLFNLMVHGEDETGTVVK